MSTPSLAHDLALKRTVHTPVEQKPHYAWRDVLAGEDIPLPSIVLLCPHGEERFVLAEVADTLGKALTNVCLARGEKDIFTGANRAWVVNICRELAANLVNLGRERTPLTLTLNSLYELIEKTLVDNNEYFVAKSLLINRGRKLSFDRDAAAQAAFRVIRRNNQIVPWSEQKVEIAVRKTFLSLHRDSAPAVAITRAVADRVEASKQAFVHIEEIQDMVQEELMKAGHYKVAEAYILFRAERAAAREADASEVPAVQAPAPEQETLVVVKRINGENALWDGADLRKRIEFARIGLDLCLSPEEIEQELRRAVYDQITQKDLDSTIILNSKTLIEKDADFAKFAGRLQLTYIYEEVLGWNIMNDGIGKLKEFHQRCFRKYLEHGVAIKRLNPRLLEYDLPRLAAALDPSADLEFDFLGIQTLYDRYLIVDKVSRVPHRIETPQFFWLRVAMGLFLDEKTDREAKIVALYNLYKTRRFCSSTPTLFNSGTLHSQLSSCYLYYVEDTIEGIFQRGIAENAYLAKWAGGLGGSWTAVRGTGAYIGGTNGESQGVIPFLKLHNDQLVAVNQGGKRKGSGCAYLETWHNDIFEFLELRKNTGDDRRRTHDMNTANWIPDLFMKRVEARQPWTLFRSNEAKDLHELYGKKFEDRYIAYEKLAEQGKMYGMKIEAIDLWKKMLSLLFETGHPWITFKDACNVRSPQDHVGVIHSSNLCTEITLNTSADETAVCNLGSIILDSHLRPDGSLDHEKLAETIRVAVRALDNVIDINFYPTEAARRSNIRHRPIGLGVMGLANALYTKAVAFASPEAVEFNDEAMEAVAYYAFEASSDIAAERGAYSSYKGSKWDRGILPQDSLDLLELERGVAVDVPRGGKMDWTSLRAKIAAQGMRNSNVLAIAPTATISNITNTSPCIEPTYKNLFVKSNLSGEFIVLNPFLVRDLKARGLWDQDMIDNLKYFDGEVKDIDRIPADLKARYLTAFDIDPKWIVDAAARRQKWIDQSQSVNLWIKTPDLKTLSHMYRHAWHAGLKTTYYLRSLGASNIEKATVAAKKETRGAVKEGADGGQNSGDAGGSHAQGAAGSGAQAGADAPEAVPGAKRNYTAEEKNACSIEAMKNGEICEACQ
jgi:ribonucleoside-diphosphate reductase alpha chain